MARGRRRGRRPRTPKGFYDDFVADMDKGKWSEDEVVERYVGKLESWGYSEDRARARAKAMLERYQAEMPWWKGEGFVW